MNEKLNGLSGVAETLLFPLYVRALESRRPDALLVDEGAAALVTRYESSFDRIRQVHMDAEDQAALILHNREFDRHAAGFLSAARMAPSCTSAAGWIRATGGWLAGIGNGATLICPR